MKAFLLTLVLGIPLLIANNPDSPKRMDNSIVFYSLPRSGTNWTIAGLQVLTRRYAAFLDSYPGLSSKSFAPHWNRLKLKLDKSKPPIRRTHYGKRILGKNNKILMVLRNYRETALRACLTKIQAKNSSILSQNQAIKAQLERLKSLLEAFEFAPETDRHLFFYEDLVTTPEKTFRKLLDFLEEPDTYFEHFIENLDDYKRLSIASYHLQHRSYSQGKSVHYHAKNASKKMIAKIDKMAESIIGPYLFDKYLNHYCQPRSLK